MSVLIISERCNPEENLTKTIKDVFLNKLVLIRARTSSYDDSDFFLTNLEFVEAGTASCAPKT